MPTGAENVRFQGRSGSNQTTVEMTRLTHSGHCPSGTMGPLHAGIIAQTPLGRLGMPDDVAWAAVYLASDESKFMTGQVISPNGGWY